MDRLTFLILAALCGTALGGLHGKVTLKGAPPSPDQPIRVTGDPKCSHSLTTENWKIGEGGALADVVIALQNASAANASDVKGLIDQQGCHYVPHVVAIGKGGTVTFKNSDATLHNIHGIDLTGGSPRDLFNIGQATAGMMTDRKFDVPGLYKIKCDVHPWMLGWIFVAGSSFVAVSGADGAFQIPGKLPDGEYTVQAWHSGFDKALTQKFSVKAGDAEINFEFDANNAK
jgi:plastocyanin